MKVLIPEFPMRLETILNHCMNLKSFVYSHVCFENTGQDAQRILVDIVPRKNGRAICSGCFRSAKCYDRSAQARLFDFVPLWGIAVVLRYTMRRVKCKHCGVKVELLPWCRGKSSVATPYQIVLARWARRLAWKEVAEVFHTSWDKVYQSVKFVVNYGLKHRELDGIEAIGVDEIQYGQGQKYLTLVYQIDPTCKRLLAVSKRRTIKSFLRCLRTLGKAPLLQVKYVCSDMWPAYLKVIKKKFPSALNILDRFHIVKKLTEAVDDVRKAETKRLKAQGLEPVLNNSRYCFLKNIENLTTKQSAKLSELLQFDLRSVRAYLLKEAFQVFWTYTYPARAQTYLRVWCTRAMRSRLDPMKKFVKMIRKHEPLIMNWFKAKKAYSSGTVEGLNRKINLVTRKAYGYKNLEVLEIALFHTMGKLPEPKLVHRFV